MYVLYTIFYVIALLNDVWISILAIQICGALSPCFSLSLTHPSAWIKIEQIKLNFEILQSIPNVYVSAPES